MADRQPVVAMLMYPGFTHLDLVGPHATWAFSMDVRLVWKDLEPVTSDLGMSVLPTDTFSSFPDEVDIVFVPGGAGTADCLTDTEVLDFLADRGSRARYVTSVCTGSLVLAAAGLLKGRRAGTHWQSREHLAPLGVECVTERVVIDGNRITGGGVTAGIDFGLTVLSEMQGEEQAQLTQLALEYDPAPPFDSGTPEKADPATVETVRAMFAEPNAILERSVAAAAGALSGATT